MVVYYFGKKREQILALSNELTRIHVLVSRGSKIQHEFYSYETSNSQFFETQTSEYLDRFQNVSIKIDHHLNTLRKLHYFNDFELASRIDLIQQELHYNRELFARVEKQILKRGFKDYGEEGAMREYVHRLEAYPEIVYPSRLLSMRRHEKDFILRNDSQYIKKLHREFENISNDIANNNSASKEDLLIVLDNLDRYKDHFNRLVPLELEIGLKTNSGLIGSLNETNEVLDSYFFQALLHARKKEKSLLNELQLYFLMVFLLFCFSGIRWSFLISKRITAPLRVLSASLSRFVDSRFTEKSEIKFTNRKDEIGALARNVSVVEEEILDQINFFNQKVEEKTREIKAQHTQIELKNKELNARNAEIGAQKLVVEDRNQQLLDSIRYAKRIQTTILPDQGQLHRILPEHFIFYQPKDIVSGDFYWVEQGNDKEHESYYVASVDCTGHGVPGAFMSVLGYTTLNEGLREHPTGNPATLLTHLHNKVSYIFNKNGNEEKLRDGMDLSLIRVFPKKRHLEFAGAFNSLFIVRHNDKGRLNCTAGANDMKMIVNETHTLYEIRGDRYAIGNQQNESHFSCHQVALKKGDRIYMTTDGYTDQFGGPSAKRFQKKRFRELILSMAQVEMNRQQYRIQNQFNEWSNNIEQIDDVCVIGMEI